MSRNEIIEIRVSGIPAKARVEHFLNIPGNRSLTTAETPEDYYGYQECDYEVLDSRGRPAPWLERKLDATKGERDRVDQQVITAMLEGQKQARADFAYDEWKDRQMEKGL